MSQYKVSNAKADAIRMEIILLLFIVFLGAVILISLFGSYFNDLIDPLYQLIEVLDPALLVQ